ncbi:MAG: hypothetical protein PHG47_01455 [Sulfuricella sp.]|nr:hypothetical protein [Sulfuricella sp.]
MKKIEKIISAAQCRRSAQIFLIGSMLAVIFPPLIMVWIAASIFVYASAAHHPDCRVGEYQRWAGYRFYGVVGTLVVILNFTGELKALLGGTVNMWLTVWAVCVLVVVPLGIRDMVRINRENWQDMTVEVEAHE